MIRKKTKQNESMLKLFQTKQLSFKFIKINWVIYLFLLTSRIGLGRKKQILSHRNIFSENLGGNVRYM